MTTYFNKRTSGAQWLGALAALLLGCLVLASCEKKELDIQQDFPFEVKLMPVPGAIANGQTVEIRITIQRTGNFSDAKYYIRYFQSEGEGILQYYDNPPYLPNDLYPLDKMVFRLYYTSQYPQSQSFSIWVSDNFGNEEQLNFEFNSSE
jgi:hypothetical protein